MELWAGLNARKKFIYRKPDSISTIASDYYPEDFENQIETLKQETISFREFAINDSRFENTKSINQLSVTMMATGAHTIFPTLYRVVQLVCMLPVLMESAERSFSVMKRVKTRLRTKIGYEWLSDLLLLSTENDLTIGISRDEVLDRFSSASQRRIPL
ncbi:hypothetical protein F441_06779 [Phytophthora nicotianae CJ01A1]|uniref:HAT C-terminal dimerisation domain-containing protein n=3 Tax=Phytophthora nicotianae TaxID=4792 RepID=W2J879_PHYNI|nr:hypothetical protein L915_06646 [Phytophthora nicotianae]ETL42635.1 hypothetical protein L916_06584 [Phytophthora nicotianae]ETM48993.1 hypothetical protein L914_06557 [Phytophthora nicotianae]ETO78062.1 hypothetical protein F444_06842 [Phytophthora nicotianae P1976]ETP19109.1 hypothetical protein F441_06779 [Phytophthora nicotianae CJ01A1]